MTTIINWSVMPAGCADYVHKAGTLHYTKSSEATRERPRGRAVWPLLSSYGPIGRGARQGCGEWWICWPFFNAEGPMCSFLLSSSIHVIIWVLVGSTSPLVPAFTLRWMRWRAASDICLDRPVWRSVAPPRSTRSWALKVAEEQDLQLRVSYWSCIKMGAKNLQPISWAQLRSEST